MHPLKVIPCVLKGHVAFVQILLENELPEAE